MLRETVAVQTRLASIHQSSAATFLTINIRTYARSKTCSSYASDYQYLGPIGSKVHTDAHANTNMTINTVKS